MNEHVHTAPVGTYFAFRRNIRFNVQRQEIQRDGEVDRDSRIKHFPRRANSFWTFLIWMYIVVNTWPIIISKPSLSSSRLTGGFGFCAFSCGTQICEFSFVMYSLVHVDCQKFTEVKNLAMPYLPWIGSQQFGWKVESLWYCNRNSPQLERPASDGRRGPGLQASGTGRPRSTCQPYKFIRASMSRWRMPTCTCS